MEYLQQWKQEIEYIFLQKKRGKKKGESSFLGHFSMHFAINEHLSPS